jgi:hypothetical protein
MNSISFFKDNFNGGTRANRFIVTPEWPTGISVNSNDSTFKIISASLPLVQINTISIPYRGRLLNVAGDRQYSPWTIGVYDDNNTQGVWQAFQRWKERMDGHYTHKVDTTNRDYSYRQYQKTWKIQQLDINNSDILRTIILYKCWPSVIGEINLNMGESNFVAFNVTLTFDYINISEGLQ